MDYYSVIFQSLLEISPIPVVSESLSGDKIGCFHTRERRIIIRPSLSPPETIHVLLHEIAHALTWDPDNRNLDKDETIAETTALIVMEWLNIPVKSYLYLMRYNDITLPEFHRNIEIIHKTAGYIISRLKRKGVQP